MARLLALLLAVGATASTQPDPRSVVDNARNATQGQASVQGQAVNRSVGRYAPQIYWKSVLDAAKSWILQHDPTYPASEEHAVAFVNDKGCAVVGGARTPLNGAAFEKAVKDLADPAKTEVLFITPQDAVALTGVRGDPQTRTRALAIGLTAELKATVLSQAHVALGRPGKNVILLNYSAPTDPREKAPDSGPLSQTYAHEFLHILLPQFGNEALGGGGRKGSPDPDIANMHHELTDYFGWSQYKQSYQSWTPPASPRSCDDAGKGAAKEAQDYLNALKPKVQP